MINVRAEIIKLMGEAAAAHHEAFAQVDGEDAEWPMWYADYCYGRLKTLLVQTITKSELVYALVAADRAFKAEKPDVAWQEAYAERLTREFGR